MNNSNYLQVKEHYENCLQREGDSCKGVDWPNEHDAEKRHQIMSGLFRAEQGLSLVDIGSGLGHYYDFLCRHKMLDHCLYTGLDISEKMIATSKKKFPNTEFLCIDLLTEDYARRFDYAVLNGVFTVKKTLSQAEMWQFFTALLTRCFSMVDKGLAFNLMSKNVDWEREDLFHVSMDELTAFLSKNLSRHFEIKHQYGLYEYTVYLYKEARI